MSKQKGSRNTEAISFGNYVVEEKDGKLFATYSDNSNEAIPEDDSLNRIIKQINSLKEEALKEQKSALQDRDRILQEIERSKSLVHYGFIALLFVTIGMLAGLYFSYFEYVSEGEIVKDYKKELSNVISDNEKTLEKLEADNENIFKLIKNCSKKTNFFDYRQCIVSN